MTRDAGAAEVADLAARVRAQRRGRRWRTALGTLAAGSSLAGLGWLVLASPVLAVDDVAVRGVDRLAVEQVRDAAAVPAGTPLARVDVAAVRERVAGLAPVADVQVVRSWPGTLELVVRERRAVAGLVEEDGVRLLDASGVAFARARALPEGVVRLQAHEAGPQDPATRAGLAVLQALPPELRDRLAIVRAHGPQQVSLLLRDGREVVWGPPGRTEEKSAAALALLRLPGVLYDVSSPQVAVRRTAGGDGVGDGVDDEVAADG